jgi:hypothetical protein
LWPVLVLRFGGASARAVEPSGRGIVVTAGW